MTRRLIAISTAPHVQTSLPAPSDPVRTAPIWCTRCGTRAEIDAGQAAEQGEVEDAIENFLQEHDRCLTN